MLSKYVKINIVIFNKINYSTFKLNKNISFIKIKKIKIKSVFFFTSYKRCPNCFRPIILSNIKCSGEIINFMATFPTLHFRKEVLNLKPPEPIKVTRPLLLYAISPLMSFHNSSLWKPLNVNCPVYHATGNTRKSM